MNNNSELHSVYMYVKNKMQYMSYIKLRYLLYINITSTITLHYLTVQNSLKCYLQHLTIYSSKQYKEI